MYCSSCGATVPDGTAFCNKCGRPIVGYSVGQTAIAPTETMGSPGAAISSSAPLYAGFWLRLAAHLIDGLIMLVVVGIIVALIVGALGVGFFQNLGDQMRTQQPNPANPAFPLAVVGIFWICILSIMAIGWVYFAGMESSDNQGTLGKMAMSLAVTDMSGNRVTFARASGRYFAKFVTNLVPFFIGYIMAGFTEKKQALHDMIASCLVMRKN
jgi:uncharacterized RDD family membrane protein YckC